MKTGDWNVAQKWEKFLSKKNSEVKNLESEIKLNNEKAPK